MREIKIGSEFRPVVNTGEYYDADKLSAVVVNQDTGEECADYTVGDFTQLMRVDNDHTGTTDGKAEAGSITITMASGNTLVAGDVFLKGNVGYRVTDGSDTSITIHKELEADIDDNSALDSVANLTSYDFPCTINEVGLWNVVISHPELEEQLLKYEVVNATVSDKIDALNTGSRKMVASA